MAWFRKPGTIQKTYELKNCWIFLLFCLWAEILQILSWHGLWARKKNKYFYELEYSHLWAGKNGDRRAFLPLHSNTTRQARHGQVAEQFYPFIQTIAIADHFPSKTFAFKHHLTGEAWPACRAILPFHSNTTWQARHGQLELNGDR